jgi:N-acylneuraminate cytidylyltransferase
MKRHWPEFENSRSQDLPKEYHDTGTFYWYKLKQGALASGKMGAIIVPENRVQDIDTETDWKLAEMKYNLLNMQ